MISHHLIVPFSQNLIGRSGNFPYVQIGKNIDKIRFGEQKSKSFISVHILLDPVI